MKLVLLEIWSYLQFPFFWYLFKRYAHRDITGQILAGAILGIMNEFITEPFWVYHFRVTVYKDTPLSVIFAWGLMFALIIFFSEKMYAWIFKTDVIDPHDKRLVLFDVLGAVVIALPMETFGLKMGIWDYRQDLLKWEWGTIPIFHMPYEALAGYVFFMLVGPTFVRTWQSSFQMRRP